MAKLLADVIYGSEENLINIEMSQMGDKESRSLLIGAPPGYVGYGDGQLTNGLRDKPNSVVLFDEMEKAHPLVFDVLLRFLNEGKINDPGRSGTGRSELHRGADLKSAGPLHPNASTTTRDHRFDTQSQGRFNTGRSC
jgi:hypothetical protein